MLSMSSHLYLHISDHGEEDYFSEEDLVEYDDFEYSSENYTADDE